MKIGNIAEQEAGQNVQVYSQIRKAKRTPRQTSIMAHVAINPVRKWQRIAEAQNPIEASNSR